VFAHGFAVGGKKSLRYSAKGRILSGTDANEQVLKYPDVAPQVPYNQQLGLCQYNAAKSFGLQEMAH
jgi:hypothetical protein